MYSEVITAFRDETNFFRNIFFRTLFFFYLTSCGFFGDLTLFSNRISVKKTISSTNFSLSYTLAFSCINKFILSQNSFEFSGSIVIEVGSENNDGSETHVYTAKVSFTKHDASETFFKVGKKDTIFLCGSLT